MTKLQNKLNNQFPQLNFKFDYSLRDITYFKVGGPAEVYLKLKNKQIITEVVSFCRKFNIKITIFGGASNVIVSDHGVSGLVLNLANDDFEVLDNSSQQYISQQPNEETTIYVSAGMRTSLFVRKTVDAGLTGLEYFLGIPGMVGGAIYNNAHYLDDLISKHIDSVEIINDKNEIEWLSKKDCNFGYDTSRFHNTQDIIIGAKFKLQKGNDLKSQGLIKKATLYRAKTQPLGLPSSGCIFQNVPNNDYLRGLFPQFSQKPHVPGGFLIDQSGLKGAHEGGIEVSSKHAAFFTNNGSGTAEDILNLIIRVKSKVKEKFDIDLKEEVSWLE